MEQSPTPTPTPTPTRNTLLGWIEARVSLTEMVSFLSLFGLLPAELDSRKPLRAALAESINRPLPSYARWPHVLGIVSFLLFIYLIVTGSLLAFYYQPTASEAYRSATSIARDVMLGGLVQQSHRWASILLMCVLVLRLLRFFFGGLYARGRELVWMVAVLTLGVVTIADLSGRLLPWDARGYWTMIRAREVFDELPIIGPLSTFLVGGTGLDSLILTRFYVLHILTLPFLLLVLFYLHFSSVRRVGLSRVDDAPPVARPLRVAMYDLVLTMLFLVGGLVTLTILWPNPFDVAADPLLTPPNARPPLYLLAPHALQEMLPSIVPMFLKGLFLEGLFAVVLLLPFIDRSGGTGPRRRLVLGLGLLACLLWVVMTWWGWQMEVVR